MEKMDLQCLFVGQQSKLYTDLVKALSTLDVNAQVKLVGTRKDHIVLALRRLKGACLVFISDDVVFSLEELSDLVWRFSPDAIVVVLVEKNEGREGRAGKVPAKLSKPFNAEQFTRLQFKQGDKNSQHYLRCLVQTAQLKSEFRNCKRLLGVSEKRCQWLVESSQEPIAYITRNLHIYANSSYLKLFHINSIQELRSIAIKDMVESGEYVLFNKFIDNQLKNHNMNHSIVISMKKNNGGIFRANIHIIPSVYKGKKCLQLWAGVVDEFPDVMINEDEAKSTFEDSLTSSTFIDLSKEERQENKSESVLPHPFSVLEEKQVVKQKERPDSSAIIFEIIKRKEALLLAQKLTILKDIAKTREHHFLNLSVAEPQRKGVNNLLFEPVIDGVAEKKKIFWDKVKFTRLFQVLLNKSNLDMTLLIKVSTESIIDKEFREWLFLEIARHKNKVSHLVFVVSSQLSKSQMKELLQFAKDLRVYHCKVAVEDFSATNKSLMALKYLKPNYVFLSLEWIQKIKGDDKRETALASYIRKMELRGVKVIPPCDSDTNMRNIFTLSGASFCQEKGIKKN